MRLTTLKKSVSLFLTVTFFAITVIAQTLNPVTITISSTEYDSPILIELKDYFKANSKVKGLKSTFNNSIATMSFTYPTGAEEFWDEIPNDIKRSFKISSIDNKSIKLQVVKSSPTLTTTNKTDAKDCGCDYFPICNTDLIKFYNGKEYRGIRDKDQSITYYNCEKGKVRMLWQSKKSIVKMDGDGTYYDTYENISNETVIFDPEFPLNEEWSKVLSGNMKYIYKNIQKNVSVVTDGKQYTNVYIVQFSITSANTTSNTPKCSFRTSQFDHYIIHSQKLYYAKGVGLIKTEDILPQLYLDHLKSQFTKDPNSVSNAERSVIQGKEFYDKFIAEQKGTTKLITSDRWKLEGYLKTDQSLSPSSSNRKYVTFTDNNLMYRHENFTQKIEVSNPEIYFYLIVNDTLKFMPEFFGSLKSHGPQVYFKNYFERPTIYRFELTKYGDWGEVLKLFYFSPSAQKFERDSEVYRKILEN